MKLKDLLLLGRKAMTNLDSILKSRDITLTTKIRLVEAMVFPVVMWELDYKQSCAMNSCFWTVVLEKTLESLLDCKEIKPVNPKGHQSWIFIGRTNFEVEALILLPPDANSQFIGKDPDAEKDWRQKEKWATQDEMFRLHHLLKGHEFEQTPRDRGGQRSLACCSPWVQKESDTT